MLTFVVQIGLIVDRRWRRPKIPVAVWRGQILRLSLLEKIFKLLKKLMNFIRRRPVIRSVFCEVERPSSLFAVIRVMMKVMFLVMVVKRYRRKRLDFSALYVRGK